MHLHIVFVLLYSVCRSVGVFFVSVRHSIFYVCVTCCDLDVSERAREKARGNNNDLSHARSNRKEEIKSGTSGCGSFVVPYFNLLLPPNVYNNNNNNNNNSCIHLYRRYINLFFYCMLHNNLNEYV